MGTYETTYSSALELANDTEYQLLLIFSLTVALSFEILNQSIQRYKIGYGLAVKEYRNAKYWWWRDYWCGLIYTTTVSLWTIFCFVNTPEYFENVVATYSKSASYLIAFSLGRFIFHTGFVLRQHGLRNRLQLLHHFLAFIGFTTVLVTKRNQCLIIALNFNEIPLAVLCIRGLLIIADLGQSRVFFIVKWLLVILYVPFRLLILVITGLTYLRNFYRIPLVSDRLVVSSWFLFLIPYNITVFLQLLRRDFGKAGKKSE